MPLLQIQGWCWGDSSLTMCRERLRHSYLVSDWSPRIRQCLTYRSNTFADHSSYITVTTVIEFRVLPFNLTSGSRIMQTKLSEVGLWELLGIKSFVSFKGWQLLTQSLHLSILQQWEEQYKPQGIDMLSRYTIWGLVSGLNNWNTK